MRQGGILIGLYTVLSDITIGNFHQYVLFFSPTSLAPPAGGRKHTCNNKTFFFKYLTAFFLNMMINFVQI